MKKFALAGNPNCGKTTLFNALTGATAHVGNWPGVTIDKREGIYKKLEEPVEIVDLPGIYSLSPYTPEEIISRNYILDEKPDCVINIVDGTNLERNLYLTTQLLEINIPVVIAVNMIDIVAKKGDAILVAEIEKKFNVPVVEISALREKGIHVLMQKALEASLQTRDAISVLEDSKLAPLINKISALLLERGLNNPLFHAIRFIEQDDFELKKHHDLIETADEIKETIPVDGFGDDYEGLIASLRYKYVAQNFSRAIVRKIQNTTVTKSDKADRVLTHRLWGIPIFLFIMLLIFHLTFGSDLLLLNSIFGLQINGDFWTMLFQVEAGSGIPSPGVFLQSWVIYLLEDLLIPFVASWINIAWIQSLVADGILAGLAAIFSFFPQIMMLFLFLSILEDSGYMARIAFIMDRTFRRFGLSGKAFLPMMMCFGCGVPGAMATRTLETEKERRLTLMVSPFFSCGAKLPIWLAFGSLILGGQHGTFVVFSMYLLGIGVAIIAAILLKKAAFKNEASPFIMEFPSYHTPKFSNLMKYLWDKLKHFLFRAATVIAASIIVIWFLSNFSWAFWTGMVTIENSMLASIGRFIQPIFIPLGFGIGSDGWRFVVGIFSGLIAKENVVATLEQLAGSGGIATLIGSMDLASAYSFMAFNLLTIPCMAMVGAVIGELSKKRYVFETIGFWLAASYVVSLVIYWSIRFWWIGVSLLATLLIIVIISAVIHRPRQARV
ncbi:MAG: ferrous iron transport protein B [Bacilli bacterium]|jgi:ferrous iron transport protein B|nr:ferrous iron transport protein B [Bacilli bacterium]MDD3389187.1 ferrous iron transport protein B [Bacilli bacterium]MDD4344972.1 ferrous iron transport protein B [Bacilli bacterium]MDD4521149.1 ferrous iron transport protein B [Bacilli bacterium]MDY0399916.1 ferrous iron transport protein B [Bacilli bacterium]